MTTACSVRVRGVVQGVGFRPFVFRLAHTHTLSGWVLNGPDGVEIRLEGSAERVDTFLRELSAQAPPAAAIAAIEVQPVAATGLGSFEIRESTQLAQPTARISPDLPMCARCLQELFDPDDPRAGYPYINCTDCGPRYSIIEALPYDRASTTMRAWAMDERCASEYHDPSSRRFHAQPVACPDCGPRFVLRYQGATLTEDACTLAAALLQMGKIIAVKGLGGYHLACDARNAMTVRALRERKFRKERPFAIMVADLDVGRRLARIGAQAELLLRSSARPIVLVPAKARLPGVAPHNEELGLMLPYTPVHHLLFAGGAPDALVMTSANRSSEPIAFEDADAMDRLSGIADAFLIGERLIARRVDDSVARSGPLGPVILRRGRGYAPAAVATLPNDQPVLALGADLKNSITLVVNGQAFVSQHIGDLDHYDSYCAFQETARDLLSMYGVHSDDLVLVHDAHPQYRSTQAALEMPVRERLAVQHHRAHVASVLAERGETAWEKDVLGVSFDGTGYGDDGTIWGGEFFAGSLANGFERVAHLRTAGLVGGDAAARHPVQAAAGFMASIMSPDDLAAPPFRFPARYAGVVKLLQSGTRTFATTSMGRLFDTVAALLGFTREVTFEGQAAIWVEQLARRAPRVEPYDFPLDGRELDFRPLLLEVVRDRMTGRSIREIARAVHSGVARGVRRTAATLCGARGLDTVVVSGGVFQNALLMEELAAGFASEGLALWSNHAVPPNDGGISLGQAAMAAVGRV